MKGFNLLKLASRAVTLKLNQEKMDSVEDYNIENIETNSYAPYSKYFEESIDKMVEKLPLKEGKHILYIGSDIGEFTCRLARKVGKQGKVIPINFSSSMLQCNRENAESEILSNSSLSQSDIFSFLFEIPDNSIDGVVCAWMICHMEHGKLLQEIKRVLKTGGVIGLIEDKANSLKDLSDVFIKVIINHPNMLIKKLKFNFPKDKDYLVKLLQKQGFHVQDAWEGEVNIPCKSGADVAEYMLSLADIGFLEVLNKKLFPQFIQTFISYADARFARGWKSPIVHRLCAIVGKKL